MSELKAGSYKATFLTALKILIPINEKHWYFMCAFVWVCVFNKEMIFPSLENCFRDPAVVALLSKAFLKTQFEHILCSVEILDRNLFWMYLPVPKL